MISDSNRPISQHDINVAYEINKELVKTQLQVASQNKLTIDLLEEMKRSNNLIEDAVAKLVVYAEKADREFFRIEILFVGGLLSVLAQILTMFLKK